MINWQNVSENPLIAKATIYSKYPLVGYNILVEQKSQLFVITIQDSEDKEIYKDGAGSVAESEELIKNFINQTHKKSLQIIENEKDLLSTFKEAFEQSELFKNMNEVEKIEQSSNMISYIFKQKDEKIPHIYLSYALQHNSKLSVQITKKSFYTTAHYQDVSSNSLLFSVDLRKTPKNPVNEIENFLTNIKELTEEISSGLGSNY